MVVQPQAPPDPPEVEEDKEEVSYELTAGVVAGARSSKPFEAIHNLWRGVFVRGIVDWVLYRQADNVKKQQIWEDAHHWIFQDAARGLGSFSMTCDILGLEPRKVRRRMWTLTSDEVDQLRSRRR
jgi:hypothetical protein